LAEYSTEHKSIKWLEKIRWDKEPICPHCGGIENVSKQKSKKNKQIIHIINTWNAITIKEREPKVRANWVNKMF
jgi:hypothetical protein